MHLVNVHVASVIFFARFRLMFSRFAVLFGVLFGVFFSVVFAVLCIALFAVLLASDLRYYSRSITTANYRSVCQLVTQIVEDLSVHKLSSRPPSRRARGFPLLLLLLRRANTGFPIASNKLDKLGVRNTSTPVTVETLHEHIPLVVGQIKVELL